MAPRLRTLIGHWVAVFAPSVVFGLLELVREVIRPRFGTAEPGWVAEILGWMPNYLAGLGFVLFIPAVLALEAMVVEWMGDQPLLSRYRCWLVGAAALGAATGLTAWEFAQLEGGLVFDVADIWASIGGAATGWLLAFPWRGQARTTGKDRSARLAADTTGPEAPPAGFPPRAAPPP